MLPFPMANPLMNRSIGPIADSDLPVSSGRQDALILTARWQTAYFPALVVLGTGVRSLSAVHA
jgi:hypothetical protein